LRPLLGRDRGLSDPSGPNSPELGDGHGVVATQPERQQSLNYLGTAETSPSARRRSAQSRKASGPAQGQPQSNGASAAGPSEADEQRDRTREQRPEDSWWKRTLRYFKSIELENKGSVARDHLALGGFSLGVVQTA
jgi:hypothetical protein